MIRLVYHALGRFVGRRRSGYWRVIRQLCGLDHRYGVRYRDATGRAVESEGFHFRGEAKNVGRHHDPDGYVVYDYSVAVDLRLPGAERRLRVS